MTVQNARKQGGNTMFDDRTTLTLGTGDPFMIPPGAIHNARNIGTVTTKMLSTYVV